MDPLFRPYRASDYAACLALFDANCPTFFAPNERADYAQFLDVNQPGYELCELSGRVLGAYGLFPQAEDSLALRWILLAPDVHGRGLGTLMLQRVQSVLRASARSRLEIAASHRSAPFFARFGARELKRTPHGWGPEMHRVDMELLVMSEISAIEQTIQTYFDGIYTGDTQLLEKIFHENARLCSTENGALIELTRADWLQLVQARVAPRVAGLTRTDRIVSIDITHGFSAAVKVELSIHPKYFVDYLTLLNTKSGWQIVAKVFYAETRTSTPSV